MDVRDFVIAKTLAHSICRELVQVAFMVVTQLQGSASGTFRFRWSAASARFSLVRYRTVPECAFLSRRGAREVWGNPPRQAAGHYGECLNWANALEQPPARLRGGLRGGSQVSVRSLASRKGALCPTGGLQNALFRETPTQSALFREVAHPECAFP